MSRSTVRAIGLLLLIPAFLLGIFPYLVQYTSMFNDFRAFDLVIFKRSILHFYHDSNGNALADGWKGIWFVAVFGELLLLSLNVFRPYRRDRHKITLFE